MNLINRSLSIIFLAAICLQSFGFQPKASPFDDNFTQDDKSGHGKVEFRGVWVATINNIDWPSKPGLTPEEQKKEFLKLLDTFQKFNLNVVIFQVRAASDAFYKSEIEPWSVFLTGKQGLAPKPFYDPLAWAVTECHQRGMELHAWFNPFRVRNLGHYALDPKSFAAKNPQFVREFDKKLFLDPGYPEVRSHVLKVISEVVRNYAIDAVILDDYFYPYPVNGKKFGDEKSFAKYGRAYYPKRLKEWRRENINLFVSSIHEALQNINPKIKLGISPFGIWRNKLDDPMGSAGLRGLSSYDDLYADVRKWLMKGWVDYVIPQLYWEEGNHFGGFSSLIKWWSENSFGKPLYIGQALYRSTNAKNGWDKPDELNAQIDLLRTNQKVGGFAFYSASNIGELTSKQAKELYENQLSSSASIHGGRQPDVSDEPKSTLNASDSLKIAQLEAAILRDFRSSLDYNPISIREIWKSLSTIRPTVKRVGDNRILSWRIGQDDAFHRLALLSFKKTGNKKYLQSILEITKKSDLTISAQLWKTLKGSELLLVSRDIRNKSDQYSDFFELKRKRIKIKENPFRHH